MTRDGKYRVAILYPLVLTVFSLQPEQPGPVRIFYILPGHEMDYSLLLF